MAPSKSVLSGWERALLVLPVLAGLGLGFLLAGGILLLPLVIAPVGLIVFVVCLVALRQMMSGIGQANVRNP